MQNPFAQKAHNGRQAALRESAEALFFNLYKEIKTSFQDSRLKSLALTHLEISGALLLDRHISLQESEKAETTHGQG